MGGNPVGKILKVDSHRNGIGGERFHVVLFEGAANVAGVKGKRFVGVVLDEGTQERVGAVCCFVLDVDLLAKGDIGGMMGHVLGTGTLGGNAWRGDEFEDGLRAAVREADKRFGEMLDVQLAAGRRAPKNETRP